MPAYLAAATLESGEPLRLELGRAGRLEEDDQRRPAGGRSEIEAQPLDPEPSFAAGGSRLRPGRTDADGHYAIEGLRPGRYRLAAHGPAGFTSFSGEPFELASGEAKVVPVERRKGVVVFGKVLGPGGDPVADTWVSYGRSPEEARQMRGGEGRTDPLGLYRLDSAERGPAGCGFWAGAARICCGRSISTRRRTRST